MSCEQKPRLGFWFWFLNLRISNLRPARTPGYRKHGGVYLYSAFAFEMLRVAHHTHRGRIMHQAVALLIPRLLPQSNSRRASYLDKPSTEEAPANIANKRGSSEAACLFFWPLAHASMTRSEQHASTPSHARAFCISVSVFESSII